MIPGTLDPITVETPFNEPLHYEILGIKNDILRPRNSKYMVKNSDITKPRYSERQLPCRLLASRYIEVAL